ncbi:Bro-N domain-containing protein [Paenibacillus farraposensis]|uniref:Bro-N domain-containing protein n=1 Tax=Paenibacillus farraposensis TaxID=2807095 RepID=A0ABW4DCX6_9BACL|nr:BRO family protein [Paenibacillus farraposensis]MCC3379869.1 phage repressor protein [Paenibacillus farraposensis]
MNIRTETWLGHSIRFVEKVPGEWWAVASDVAKALAYKHTPHMVRMIDDEEKDAVRLADTIGRKQKYSVISETGIYEAIFNSSRQEAKEFKKWVKGLLKQLRQSTGLEGFQIFRMLDKDHQKEAMQKLRSSLKQPVRVDFIKANTIANKAVSSKYGHPKLLKKDQMTPDMLVTRQEILEDTVDLMGTKERFGLDIAVSQTIYDKHIH